MSPDLRDALQEIKTEHEWAHDLIRFELDRLGTLVEQNTKLQAEVDGLREALSSSRAQWRHSVNAKKCKAALGELPGQEPWRNAGNKG